MRSRDVQVYGTQASLSPLGEESATPAEDLDLLEPPDIVQIWMLPDDKSQHATTDVQKHGDVSLETRQSLLF